MAEIALNASFHYDGMSIKGENLTNEDYGRCLLCLRATDFEDGNNIESETDEGHTGGANLNMGKYRKSAESSPSFKDKLRFKEGLEDMFFMLLGTYTKNPASPRFNYGGAGATHFTYEFPPHDANELPSATIYLGYSKTADDARVFNNALLNSLKCNMSNDEAPTLEASFVSDYNNFNLANPTRNYLANTIFVKPKQVNIYYGDADLDLDTLFTKKLGCFLEADWEVNNNFENVGCQEDEFGKTSKEMGERETKGSFKLPWTLKTRKLEPEYEGGDVQSHNVTEETLKKQIAFEYVGTKIPGTDINLRAIVWFPLIDITNTTSPKSGKDVKDLTIEWEVLEVPEHSFMYVDIFTDLEDLHIDNEGCDLNDLFYTEEEETPETPTYSLEFTVTDGTDPVEGATITVGSQTGTTDATGKATLTGLSGSVSYSVSKEGYTTVNDTKTVSSNDTVDVTLTTS